MTAQRGWERRSKDESDDKAICALMREDATRMASVLPVAGKTVSLES